MVNINSHFDLETSLNLAFDEGLLEALTERGYDDELDDFLPMFLGFLELKLSESLGLEDELEAGAPILHQDTKGCLENFLEDFIREVRAMA